MEIPLETFLVMASRSDYFLRMQDYEDRLQDRVDTKTITVDLPKVTFATESNLTVLMQWLQEPKQSMTTIENIPFVTIITAAEYFVIESLRKWIGVTYFRAKPAAVAKSILWIKRFKHVLDTDSFVWYLLEASNEYEVSYSDLLLWKEDNTWKSAYKKLVKFLRRGRDKKRYRTKWCINRNCAYCAKTVNIDTRNLKDNRGNYNLYALYLRCDVCGHTNRHRIRGRIQGCKCLPYCSMRIVPGLMEIVLQADKTIVVSDVCPLHK